MINWYKKVVFENYANFNGRARRSEFWYFTLMNIIITVLLMIIDNLLNLKMGTSGISGTVYGLIVFIPNLAVSVRRLHDVGKSGVLAIVFNIIVMIYSWGILLGGVNSINAFPGSIALISLALLVIGVWMLVLLCKAGDEGQNKYGSDPKLIGEEINEIGTN